MSTFGKLMSHVSSEYFKQTSALRQNCDLVNRFGEAIAPFDLAPNVHSLDGETVMLSAASQRGRDHQALLSDLSKAGFRAGPITKLPTQFRDGYVMWTVDFNGGGLAFSLLFYVPEDVS